MIAFHSKFGLQFVLSARKTNLRYGGIRFLGMDKKFFYLEHGSGMKTFLPVFFLLLSVVSQGQISDDFSDGDFTANPAWSGEQTKFEVNASQQLHLNAPAVADTAVLSTPNTLLNDVVWEFFFILDFAPSNSNNLKVYLAADQPDFKKPLNGYFLKMGEDGSDDDIDLYRQEGTTETLVIDGIDGNVAASTNAVSIRVMRDASGHWELLSDITGGTNYTLEGSATDNTITSTAHFGFFCKYTSTRSDDFYFDDVYVGLPVVDGTPPLVEQLTVVSANQLDLLFSEPVETVSAENEINYTADNGIGDAASAVVDATNKALVHLTFAAPFPNGTSNTLIVSGVADQAGNVMAAANLGFSYYEAQPGDVIISEIFPDPDPAVGLPAVEFIELYNRSASAIDLIGWKFSDAAAEQTLPSFTLAPGSYVVLCDDANVPLFQPFGNAIGVATFPSLNNDGDDLTLTQPAGVVINAISYESEWYRDEIKSDGGWSLERISITSPCESAANWHASVAAQGGTPGAANSDLSAWADTTAPHLLNAVFIDHATIQLFFDEEIDPLPATDLSNYSVLPSDFSVTLAILSSNFKEVSLSISPAADSNAVLSVLVNGMKDCTGNAMSEADSAQVAIPSTINAGDLLINEILYNPATGGFDYLEIYNPTQNIFDLSDLQVANADDLDSLDDVEEITASGYLVFPGDFVVLTENADWVKQNYSTPNPGWLLQVENLPSFNDDEGRVILFHAVNGRIDQLNYSDDWQFPLIDETEGVALERIDPFRATQDSMNWHSAASTVGFGTPTYQNSQFRIPDTGDEITLDPQVFSPDGDGYNDFLSISYQFDQPGYTANVRIYDSQGRETKFLVRNALLSQSGTFTWDGITDAGEKAKIGTYILYIEVFDLSGNIKRYQKVCVVGARKS
jgi:hypothetical protein